MAAKAWMKYIRTEKAVSQFEKKELRKEIDEKRKVEHQKMREVESFFIEVYPGSLSEDAITTIQKVYAAGSKSQYGMILFLDRLVNFPEWKERAFEKFEIAV